MHHDMQGKEKAVCISSRRPMKSVVKRLSSEFFCYQTGVVTSKSRLANDYRVNQKTSSTIASRTLEFPR